MSDWIEEKITEVETEKLLDYLDLFEFNGRNPPKFWFGENVKFGARTGVVFGLEWRRDEKNLPRGVSQSAGWWYLVCLEGRQSLMGFHEDSLDGDLSLSGRSPPGGDVM
ncbi:hypothetical protein [Microcoleus sp. F4-D5]|uniref:hypothetical protein n=1 Tax=Microcoleus sp. F4-D5 TaxID=2818760 RepID=UPI002FD782C0